MVVERYVRLLTNKTQSRARKKIFLLELLCFAIFALDDGIAECLAFLNWNVSPHPHQLLTKCNWNRPNPILTRAGHAEVHTSVIRGCRIWHSWMEWDKPLLDWFDADQTWNFIKQGWTLRGLLRSNINLIRHTDKQSLIFVAWEEFCSVNETREVEVSVPSCSEFIEISNNRYIGHYSVYSEVFRKDYFELNMHLTFRICFLWTKFKLAKKIEPNLQLKNK